MARIKVDIEVEEGEEEEEDTETIKTKKFKVKRESITQEEEEISMKIGIETIFKSRSLTKTHSKKNLFSLPKDHNHPLLPPHPIYHSKRTKR